MTSKITVFSLFCFAAYGCGDDGGATQPDSSTPVDSASPDSQQPDAPEADAPPTDAPDGTCTTNVAGGGFTQLCTLTSPVKHVKLTGVQANGAHTSAQIYFGLDAEPASAQPTLEADQLRVLLYSGGPAGPTTLAPIVELDYGAQSAALAGDTSFVTSVSTVCFDLHEGSATTAPAVVLWVSGQNGANCDDRSTLTAANAFGVRALWRGATGAVDTSAKAFFYQHSAITATPGITLYDTPAIDEADARAAVTCSTTFTQNVDWQQLCSTVAAGPVRHVQLTNAQSPANNKYFYTVFGQDPNPTGTPQNTASAQKLIFTLGRSSMGLSWTYFGFNGGSTQQFEYANTTGALYTAAPSTVCFDLGSTTTGNLRLVFWATGAGGADCDDHATLTLANALYDSTTDTMNGAIWNAALATGKLNFIKASGSDPANTASAASVKLLSEPARL